MPRITIDGREIEARDGETVLAVALREGIHIPHFCYNPYLSIAGSCRMCLVEVQGLPKLEASCNLRVSDGMVVFTNTEKVRKARRDVLEFTLINHPLDCPVCDQAGECLLQDYYFDYSLAKSRLTDEKVKKPKARQIGPNLMLDNERCILCTRCIRFLREKTGTEELAIVKRGDSSFVTTFPGVEVRNLYSMNLVDICPVGAITSKDFRFKKRVWFLKSTPSICPWCATGCNIWLDHCNGVVYRLRPRVNNDVNECFICDEGRLSYKFVNDNRLFNCMKMEGEGWSQISWGEALSLMRKRLDESDIKRVVLVLSALRTNEENKRWFDWGRDRGVGGIYCTGREVENPSEDNWLIHADKNPNRAGLSALGVGSMTVLPDADVMIFLQYPPESIVRQLREKRPPFVVVMTSNVEEMPRWADLMLPVATFAEQDGSFTNIRGMKQNFSKAFEPKGDSMPAWQVADMLG